MIKEVINMYCRHCGEKLEDNAEICFNCGNNPQEGELYCPNCGAQTTMEMVQCLNCGRKLKTIRVQREPEVSDRSKAAAGILAVLAGAFGAHDFYLGDNGKGWAKLIATVASMGVAGPFMEIWSLIDAVKIFAGRRDDAKGRPLR